MVSGISIGFKDENFKAKVGTIKTMLQRPSSRRMLRSMETALKMEIEHLPNFHRYPNANRAMLSHTKISSRKPNTFTVTVNPVSPEGYHYGDIIEYGRPAITGKWMKFQGYYPNIAKVYTAIRKQIAKYSPYKRVRMKEGRRIMGELAVLEHEMKWGEAVKGTGFEDKNNIDHSGLISEIIRKYPIDEETVGKLTNKKSDIYTIIVNPKVGVKAAYQGNPPHIMTDFVELVKEQWKKELVVKIRKVGNS